MLDTVVNRVFHLDANRSEIIYNVGWKPYLLQRETDERRRRRERLNAEKKASALLAQADKMRAKATKATAAQNMARRAERLLAGIEGERAHDRVAKLRFPSPAPCGRTPLTAEGLSRSYGSLEVFTDVDRIDRGSRRSGSERARRRCCASSPASTLPTRARCFRGTASNSAITRRNTRTSTSSGPCWRT
jgi:ATPase subunit of ABC transporter with duplicated ATPase domains